VIPPARKQSILGAAAIVALVALAYVPALWAGFIWDDDLNVTALTLNPHFHSLDGLRMIWCELEHFPQYYPLVHTTFWV
jgi:protein O-mannosyl-transferase